MNTIFKILLLSVFCFNFTFLSAQTKVIVKFKGKIETIEYSLNKDSQLREIKLIKLNYLKNKIADNYAKIVVNSKQKAKKIIQLLKRNPKVISAYIEPLLKVYSIPNDSLFQEQWGLKTVHAPEAWEVTKGKKEIKIGLIDTGIRLNHPDLEGIFYVNPAEDLNGNGILDSADIDHIDNDGNGFVDDVSGLSFVNGEENPFPLDDNGHGTYIAGILAAKQNNKIGISGIAPDCKILNLKAFNSKGYGSEEDVARAIVYAVSQDVRVINMSFGDTTYSSLLKDVIHYAYSKGVFLVASAGNTGNDVLHYPSSFDEVLSVGAIDNYLNLAPFSSFGSNLDLVAPGVYILTTGLNKDYAKVSGTSASAPFVNGVATLILSVQPTLTPEEVKQLLKSTAYDIYDAGWDVKTGAGVLNLYAALTKVAPAIIKFNAPLQNQAFAQDSIPVNITLINPNLTSYTLYLGEGRNPQEWEKIKVFYKPVVNTQVVTLQMQGKKDTIYTLRLTVNTHGSKTLEERVNFFYDTSPPEIVANTPVKALKGKTPTIFAELKTDDLTKASLYFKRSSENNWREISLDETGDNLRNVKNYHYGFAPVQPPLENGNYQAYLSAENLSGLTTTYGSKTTPFEVKIENEFNVQNTFSSNISLPNGELFPQVLEEEKGEKYLLFKENKESKDFYYKIIRFKNNNFETVDSIKNVIPIFVGKVGEDSTNIIIGKYQRTGYILKQLAPEQMSFEQVFVDSSGNFFPVLAADLNNDGNLEIICNKNDEKYLIYTLTQDFKVNLRQTILIPLIKNDYSRLSKVNNNISVSTEAGFSILWTLTPSGSLIGLKIASDFSYSEYFREDFNLAVNFSNSISVDQQGTSTKIACLFKSPNPAPYYYLLILTKQGKNFAPYFEELFLGEGQNENFFSKDYSKIAFLNRGTNSTEKSLFINVQKYFYIFDLNSKKYLYFDETVAPQTFFAGNFTSFEQQLIATTKGERIQFFSFENEQIPPIPFDFYGYQDGTSFNYLSWEADGSKFFIYRSIEDSVNLNLIDSTTQTFYRDTIQYFGRNYFYAVKSFDEKFNEPFSPLSKRIQIFTEDLTTLQIISKPLNDKSLELSFSTKICKIQGKFNYQVSLNGSDVSPAIVTASDTSYFLFFSKNFSEGENTLKIFGFRTEHLAKIPATTINFNFQATDSTSPQFYVESYRLVSSKEVELQFNLPVDELSAENTNNYEITPTNPVTKAEVKKNVPNVVKIRTQNPVGGIGIEYVLEVKKLFSSKASGSIPLRKGAGSSVLLTEEVKNLAEMFVFPNPVNISQNKTLHFAKVPAECEIEIFSITGKHVASLRNKGRSGGFEWDLRNKNGNLISSGVYLYKAIVKDEFGNEKETIIKKFAVIR